MFNRRQSVNNFSSVGINIHDPQYMRWWRKSGIISKGTHQTYADGFNEVWSQWISTSKASGTFTKENVLLKYVDMDNKYKNFYELIK